MSSATHQTGEDHTSLYHPVAVISLDYLLAEMLRHALSLKRSLEQHHQVEIAKNDRLIHQLFLRPANNELQTIDLHIKNFAGLKIDPQAPILENSRIGLDLRQ